MLAPAAPGSPPPAWRPRPVAAARQPTGPDPATPFPLAGSGARGRGRVRGGARGPASGSDWPLAPSIAGEEAEARLRLGPWEQPWGPGRQPGWGRGGGGGVAQEEGSRSGVGWGGTPAANARGGDTQQSGESGWPGPGRRSPERGRGRVPSLGRGGSLGARMPAARAWCRMVRGRRCALRVRPRPGSLVGKFTGWLRSPGQPFWGGRTLREVSEEGGPWGERWRRVDPVRGAS